ncbi:MAG: hypothetical protein FWF65_09630 [Bacteroidetes bacterium]|nr:hypothetical protein [Bacteroidota bacterium]
MLVNGFKIDAIVCDGLRGMFQLFSQYRVQMCQFHQVSIVKRYLTQRPELEASIELLNILKQLCHTDKERFVALFEQWIDKWSFLIIYFFCCKYMKYKHLTAVLSTLLTIKPD